MMLRKCLGLLCVYLVPMTLWAKTPGVLTIKGPDKTVTWTADQLLKRNDDREINLPLLNYPNQNLPVMAVPLATLLEEAGIKTSSIIQFECLDGYAGLIDSLYLFSQSEKGARAWLAFETVDRPWPALPKESNTVSASAGPFYLVWEQPEQSQIPPEFWPYQLKELRAVPSLAQQFPGLLPAADADTKVKEGFKVFQQRCLACHQMNGDGPASIGPDLNRPMNPTRYFQRAALKQFIKDPTSVRQWPTMKMRWVVPNAIREAEAEAIIAYLAHMDQKTSKPQSSK